MRLKIFTVLLAALLLALIAGLRGDTASAQRKRPANDNTSQTAQKAGQTKHVFVGRGSDTAQGSRVTIKSDNPLNDYSAYRSGDRFYVVLPRAAAGSVAHGGGGKGYSDMQVQQRGDSVVLSYRVQPGAKPRVEQKFNRLDVVFDAPGGGESSAASNAGQSSTAPSGNNARTTTANENRNPNTSGQSAGQTASTSAAPNTSATSERRNAAGAENAGQPGAGQQNAGAPNATTPPPGAGEPSGVEQGAQGTTPASEQVPEATPAGEQQVAVAQPQTQIAPITNTNPASSTEAGSSLGTFLLRNWAMALVIALVVAGFGLIIAARRSSAASPASLEGLGSRTTATLNEPRAARLKDAPAGSTLSTAEVSRAADAVPLASASALATGAPAEEAKEESKREEEWAEELPLVEGSAAAGAAVVEPAAEEQAAEEPAVEESAVEDVSTGVEPLAAVAEEKSGAALAEEKTDTAVAEPFASATEPTLVDTGAVAASEAAASSKEIASTAEVDPDRARAETRHLLEGEQYERAVVGTSDSMARQMIAAELLSALAGRNPERRERARAAFVENGYFDETARDLRDAEAPAERAAAARSLALVGDRSATPHLVVALDDNSIDVRRAAVEALGALRDPAAVAPLESLYEREKQQRNRIPNRVIRNAIEFCREAAEEERAAESRAIEVSPHAEPQVAEPQPFETTVGEAQAAEETGLQHVEETATQPFVESEQVTPQVAAETSEQPSVVGAETTAEAVAPSAETGQATLFEESAAAGEATREIEHAPVGVAEETTAAKEEVASKEEVAAGEWFEFDIQEERFEPQPTAVEPAPSVFEPSSGEAISPSANEVGRAAEELQTFEAASTQIEHSTEPAHVENGRPASAAQTQEKGVAPFDEFSTVPASIQQRIASPEPSERAAAITELSHVDTDEAFQQICAAFDDEAKEVRSAAARALYDLRPDRADSFTRALREATSERRRQIGAAISSSGLANEAISQLTGESREKTYEAFSLLFLMAKAGEVQPLIRAIEGHPNSEVRLAVVKLLALSGQKEILPAFRRLAVRGSLPTEVRSAVMEAIYQISSQPVA